MKKNNTGGISVVDILQVVFIVLKLVGSITWSWWWVLSPTWITILIIIMVCVADYYLYT